MQRVVTYYSQEGTTQLLIDFLTQYNYLGIYKQKPIDRVPFQTHIT